MTATDYDFIANRNKIIYSALRKVGAISVGDVADGETLNNAVEALNEIVKSWQNEHLFLWQVLPQTKALTSPVASYAMETNPAIYAIDSAYIRLGTGQAQTDIPVEVITFKQYNAIVNKQSRGQPYYIAVDNQNVGGFEGVGPWFYVYPTPDKAYTLFYTGIVALKDFELAGGNGDITAPFQRALIYALANDLADDYGVPSSECAKLESKAERLFLKAKRNNRDHADREVVEGSFYYGKHGH